MSGLQLDKLSMRFDLPDGGMVQALQDVSIDLKAGELLSVLGPSGCGKTTLLNIVAGFLAPTSGEIILNEKRVYGPGPERGMVFQQGALFEWMSVRENVGFGPKMKGMAAKPKREIVDHLLNVVGLQDFKEKAVYELSGGMQQRVALARCLANEPDVILMDEPLGALDALTREKMQGLVLKLWKETGKTIILITHSVEEALLLGERLIVMAPRPGRIHREYNLPFAEMGVGQDLREVKKHPDFATTREEILSMIWDMEEEIMGGCQQMSLMSDLGGELVDVVTTIVGALPFIIGYVLLILATMFVWSFIKRLTTPKHDYGSLKTVTFGDESAVASNTVASVVSIVLIFVFWGAFTGSKLLPGFLHMPGAYVGESSFTYTATVAGRSDDAEVAVVVFPIGERVDAPAIELGDGFAKNDSVAIASYRNQLLRVDQNDELGRTDGAEITAVNGQPISPDNPVKTDFGTVSMSPKGTLNIVPAKGMQMEPIWLPAPEAVWKRFREISSEGYRNSTLAEHLGFSLFRVVVGFFLGAIVGIPLGYAMGLSNWFRGWFDPIVEFMRPVPPLALIPLVIIWAGIGEVGKIILLFLAALWIMAIAARSGVSGVRISKVHAAYSLGASKWQIMRYVIIPNSLPEIFTGARVAMGVCWGTVVAAELVAAEKGAGMMIMVASKFQSTDIVLMGIILIGIIGFSIDMLMRWVERILVPWKGKG